ncbi:hypothetical protein BOX15_Mlig007609g1 [Macrostomum lignano]|uniref:Amiloride-sensitive sodium channel n=1 Tax=Macrostomum lignano TaxID=282301 RepID=A0A267G831_9PLAT|nr:hypothetical protein BOX15_Mlig007609g1 [Macrostomum lignano]
MGSLVRQGRYLDASKLFHNDRVTTYFQLINESELNEVSHHLTDLMPFCIARHIGNASPSKIQETTCQFKFTRIHHPEFFTCYNLKMLGTTEQLSEVSLILSNVRNSDLYGGSAVNKSFREMEEQAFNAFNQATGFRVVLHEPGTFPNVDSDSFTVQTGTATLIRYQTVRVEKENYPEGECSNPKEQTPIRDHDHVYNYTQTACVSDLLGKRVTEICNCVSAFQIISQVPSKEVPYCGHYHETQLEEFLKRYTCVQHLNLSSIIRHFTLNACRKPCTQYFYNSHLSVANWAPRLSQLRWMGLVSGALRHASLNASDRLARWALPKLLEFCNLESIGASGDWKNNPEEQALVERMALIRVSRLNYNTVLKQEKLQITLSALVSRIGGLGSLTIGVTLTFAFEFLELLFLLLHRAVYRCQQEMDASHSRQSCPPDVRVENVDTIEELMPLPARSPMMEARLRGWSDVGFDEAALRRLSEIGNGC